MFTFHHIAINFVCCTFKAFGLFNESQLHSHTGCFENIRTAGVKPQTDH